MRSRNMSELRIVIVPSSTATRVQGSDSRGTKVWASLPAAPLSPEALPMLLDALGRFVPVRAALVVDAREPSFATRLYPDWWIDEGGDHYRLELAGREPRRAR
jgi:hypothetical protein